MDKKEITAFFDSLAESWDAEMIKSQWKIDKILKVAGVTEGISVLDVACGTGVLVPDYIDRKIGSYVGIDISHNMVKIAEGKFAEHENLSFICGDAEVHKFSEAFDCIVIYNALPHFPNPVLLFENLKQHLKEKGRITIAHGMSREALIKHHSGRAKPFSTILPEIDDLKGIMQPYFNIDVCVSDDEIYIISGTRA
ncbi:MAG: class I SAM-dependent methyltransferase [Clostridia bacterium]|nr:class I SAM-dependent methyltransferase [Clostridia bacterium]